MKLPHLSVGLFLEIAFGLAAGIIALEIWLYYQKRHITISELSHQHQGLRWLIELGIVLFGVWWAWHSKTLR